VSPAYFVGGHPFDFDVLTAAQVWISVVVQLHRFVHGVAAISLFAKNVPLPRVEHHFAVAVDERLLDDFSTAQRLGQNAVAEVLQLLKLIAVVEFGLETLQYEVALGRTEAVEVFGEVLHSVHLKQPGLDVLVKQLVVHAVQTVRQLDGFVRVEVFLVQLVENAFLRGAMRPPHFRLDFFGLDAWTKFRRFPTALLVLWIQH